MTMLLGWLRVAMIDLRGDLGRFGVLLACLALGVGTITAVGSVGAALQAAISRDARLVLGGDLEAQLSYRFAEPAERALFEDLGEVTEVIEAAGRTRAGDIGAFVALRAVDTVYPLLGSVTVAEAPTQDLDTLLSADAEGVYGMVADSLLLDRMMIAIGDVFELGTARFKVTGLLEALPDQATQGIQLGIPTLVSVSAMQATGLLEPGVIARYRYKIALEPGVTYPDAKARILAAFPDAGWQVRDPAEAAESLARYADLFARFLTVVGLSSLLVGGVGVSNAVSAYITERERSIATIRSLGATSARIMVHFLSQIMVLTLLGIVIGVTLGSLLTWISLPIIGDLLAVNLDPQLHVPSIVTASIFGILIGFAFAFLPLSRARLLRPAMLFRSAGGAAEGSLGWREISKPQIWLPLLFAGLGIALMALIITGRPWLVLWYTVGVVVGFGLLRLAGYALQSVLRLIPPPSNASLRNALKSIYRPGALAPAVIVSLGMGLALLLLIAMVDNNLRTQISGQVAEEAPTFVLVDLFEDEVEEISALAATDPRIETFTATPMLRAAITKVKDMPASGLGPMPENVAFVFEGEAPITWMREQPEDSPLVEGTWWPADYSGEPLISLAEEFKAPLGLALGDTFEFSLYGDVFTAKIANFRRIDWSGGGVNFAVVLSPGYVEAFPTSALGLMKVAPGDERGVQTMLIQNYPDMIFVPVGDALAVVTQILGSLSDAIAVVGGLAVISGLFVLAGAMAAGRRQREADAVVMKVLGATRGDVVKAYVIEYGLLGALAAIVAAILGVVGAWALVTQVMELDFSVDFGLILMVVAGAVVATVVIGTITTWAALSVRPVAYLRGE